MIPDSNILKIKEVFLPFLFKYYLFSHFPDEIKLLFHIIPSLLPEKIM